MDVMRLEVSAGQQDNKTTAAAGAPTRALTSVSCIIIIVVVVLTSMPVCLPVCLPNCRKTADMTDWYNTSEC